jgi:hypothetical protein
MSDKQATMIRVIHPDPKTTMFRFPLRKAEGHRVASSSIDPLLLEEFRLAEGSRALFGELDRPIEPWLALQLARTDGDLLRRECERVTRLKQAGRAVSLGGLIADSLDRIRIAMCRRARELRAVLAASGVPLDPVHLELVLAVLLRDGASTPLNGEIRLKATEVDLYLTAPALGASDKAQVLPQGVDSEILEDLRRIKSFFSPLASVRPKMELWEAFLLVVRDRDGAEQTPKRMRAPDAEVVHRCKALVQVRLEKALLAHALKRYVAGLPIGSFSSDTMELTFAFILASPEGCRRAQQWMESPEQFKREAAIRVEGVIGRAQKYLHALRATA